MVPMTIYEDVKIPKVATLASVACYPNSTTNFVYERRR